MARATATLKEKPLHENRQEALTISENVIRAARPVYGRDRCTWSPGEAR
jgi:hypothetical protein